MEFLDKIMVFLDSAIVQAGIIGVVVEYIFRLFPTQKPLSIAHLIGGWVGKVGLVLVKLGDFLDKVLPQKTVPPTP